MGRGTEWGRHRSFRRAAILYVRAVVAALVVLSVCAALALPPRAAYADDGRLGPTPEGVYPMRDTWVMMVSEVVRIRLAQEETTSPVTFVNCEFAFTNTGPADTVLMGFPARLWLEDDDPDPGRHNLAVRDFTASVDGVPVPVTLSPGLKPEGIVTVPEVAEWATFEVPFASGQSRIVRHTYSTTNTSWSNGEVLVGYILRTGGLWAEPIGHILVEVDMGAAAPWHITRMSPSGWVFRGANTWVFEARNLRPEHDLSIVYNHRPLLNDPSMLPEDMGPAAYTDWKAEFERADAAAGNPDSLLAMYRGVEGRIRQDPWNPHRLLVLAAYIASLLPADRRPALPETILPLQELGIRARAAADDAAGSPVSPPTQPAPATATARIRAVLSEPAVPATLVVAVTVAAALAIGRKSRRRGS